MRFTGGMQPDANIYDFVDGTWVNAKNIRRVNGVIEVDYGTVDVATLGGEVVGVCNTGNNLYIFTSEETAGRDRIYKFDGTTVTLLLYTDLDFIPTRELEVVYKFNDRNEIVLAWVDGVNPLRVLNVDDFPFIGGINETYKTLLTDSNLSIINVAPFANVPYVNLNRATDGNLSLGVYQIAIRYKYKDVTTKWMLCSDRILLFGKVETYNVSTNIDTSLNTIYDNAVNYIPFLDSENNNNSLSVTLSNLDSKYDTIDIALLKSLATGEFENTCGILTNISISSYSELNVFINGIFDTYVTLEEILDSPVSILKAKTLTNFRDKILIGNYESNVIISDIATTLATASIKWVIHHGSSKSTTFKWGEVYALYAAYVYNDGSLSQFEHIPGRTLETADRVAYSTVQDNMLQLEAKTFHITDTTKDITINSDGNIEGKFGAWENENETYNDGSKVRHFRFPHKSVLSSTYTGWSVENKKYARLGIRIDLSAVTLPTGVQGIVIAYAKRSLDNSTALDDAVYVRYETDVSGTNPIYGSLNGYLLINNRYVPSNPYLARVFDGDFELISSVNTIQHLPDISFKIEDNSLDNNESAGDKISTSLIDVAPLIANTVTIMNDVRDIYIPTYGQNLVYATYVKDGDTKDTLNGDVYTSIYYDINIGMSETLYPNTNSDVRQGIITSPIIQDFLDISGLPLFDGQIDDFEKGVQTLSLDRFYVRTKAMSTLCINKPLILTNNTSRINIKHYNDIAISNTTSSNTENWQLFNGSDYYTIPNINGSIYQLITYGNALYIRTDRSIYVAKIRDTFDMSNGTVGLKSGELFDQIPQELLPTSHGLISGNSKLATNLTKIGVVMVDITTASIYILGQELVDLTITNKEYFKWLFNDIYEGVVNKPVNSVHLSSLSGAAICYENNYNRLFIILNTKVLTFDVMTKQLISVHDIEPNYMFNLLGKDTPYYICGNSEDGFKIKKLSNTTYPDEAYIEFSVAIKEAPILGLNKISWNTLDGNNSTIKAISIWSDLSATGEIDIVTADVSMVSNNNTIVGNTTFDVTGIYSFNDIFDNVINKAVSIFTSDTRYQVEINNSNININKRDTDMFANHFRIRLYLKKSGIAISNRNCKLKSVDLVIKSYTSK